MHVGPQFFLQQKNGAVKWEDLILITVEEARKVEPSVSGCECTPDLFPASWSAPFAGPYNSACQ